MGGCVDATVSYGDPANVLLPADNCCQWRSSRRFVFFVFLTNVFFFFFNVISDILCFHSPADFTPLIVPAATLGAIGYGYMWYKVSLIRVPKVFLQ